MHLADIYIYVFSRYLSKLTYKRGRTKQFVKDSKIFVIIILVSCNMTANTLYYNY